MPLIMVSPYRKIVQAILDAYADNVALLMHMDGTNGGKNFTDEYGAICTSFGGTGATTDTGAFKFGSSSALLGTDRTIAIADPGAKFSFTSSEDFTAECWVNVSSFNSNSHLFGNFQWNAGYKGGWRLTIGSQGWLTFVGANNTAYTSTGNLIKLNTWHHVAVTRQNNLYRIFVDGVLASSASNANAIPAGSLDNYFRIGGKTSDPNVGIDDYLFGHVDELRITRGVARYTANFSVPTAPFANPTTVINDAYQANIPMLLHAEGANGSKVLINNGYGTGAFTFSGGAQISTDRSRFGTSSLKFTGGTDMIVGPADASGTNLDSGDFTIEAWVYPTGTGPYAIISRWQNQSYIFSIWSGTLDFTWAPYSTNNALMFAGTPPVNAWSHVAVTRQGNVWRMFVNGTQVATATFATNATPNASVNTVIGNYGISAGNSNGPFVGYIDELRVTKGLARYTGNFTVPNAQFADSNDPLFDKVVLLMHMEASSATGFTDVKAKSIGNVGVIPNTSVVRFNSSSAYFGNNQSANSHLTIPKHSDFLFDTGDFCIEMFAYQTARSTQWGAFLYDGRAGATNGSNNAPYLCINPDGTLSGGLGGPQALVAKSTTVVSLNAWHHFAFTRTNGVISIWLDGVKVGSVTDASSAVCDGTPFLGCAFNLASTTTLCGYMDEVRITKGAGRYTQNFTVPASTFA